GRLSDMGKLQFAAADIEPLLLAALDPVQRGSFDAYDEVDFAYTLPGVGRFRANVFRQLRGTDGVFRLVPARPPTLQDLKLPAILANLTTFHQGMVLLTGPSGCGKSATMAALINIINDERPDHILTIEDPI